MITDTHALPPPIPALDGNQSAKNSLFIKVICGLSYIVHNHPSGDTEPSAADIAMTEELRSAAEKLGIAIHDHLVIGRAGHASFRSLGLL